MSETKELGIKLGKEYYTKILGPKLGGNIKITDISSDRYIDSGATADIYRVDVEYKQESEKKVFPVAFKKYRVDKGFVDEHEEEVFLYLSEAFSGKKSPFPILFDRLHDDHILVREFITGTVLREKIESINNKIVELYEKKAQINGNLSLKDDAVEVGKKLNSLYKLKNDYLYATLSFIAQVHVDSNARGNREERDKRLKHISRLSIKDFIEDFVTNFAQLSAKSYFNFNDKVKTQIEIELSDLVAHVYELQDLYKFFTLNDTFSRNFIVPQNGKDGKDPEEEKFMTPDDIPIKYFDLGRSIIGELHSDPVKLIYDPIWGDPVIFKNTKIGALRPSRISDLINWYVECLKKKSTLEASYLLVPHTNFHFSNRLVPFVGLLHCLVGVNHDKPEFVDSYFKTFVNTLASTEELKNLEKIIDSASNQEYFTQLKYKNS